MFGLTIKTGRFARTDDARTQASLKPSRRRMLIRAAEFCFAAVLRLAPQRRRFGVTLLMASAAVPLLSRTSAYRQ